MDGFGAHPVGIREIVDRIHPNSSERRIGIKIEILNLRIGKRALTCERSALTELTGTALAPAPNRPIASSTAGMCSSRSERDHAFCLSPEPFPRKIRIQSASTSAHLSSGAITPTHRSSI